nr:hypothetical protein [Sulfurovaceae bacterium]
MPDKNNQIIIYLNNDIKAPVFYVIFSKEKFPKNIIDEKELIRVKNSNQKDILVIKLHSKKAVKQHKYHYFFGNRQEDKDRSWNNGVDFSWKDWKKYDADIWDNIAVVYIPQNEVKYKSTYLTNIVIRRGNFTLLDTRKKTSLVLKRKISFKVQQVDDVLPENLYYIYHFGNMIRRFKEEFYETKSPIIKLAISDLGQTDKTKYVSRGKNWCSEYAAYLYNKNGIIAPNPNTKDLHFKNLKEFYKINGKVYSYFDVNSWSDLQKQSTIKTGTLVSFCTNNCENAHTVIFKSWLKNRENKITHFSAVSGNNQGMVYFHRKILLNT